jgi:HK97 family phage prohead protease
MGNMQFKDCKIEVKAIQDDGYFDGYLSTYDVDLGGDRIWPGAFKKTSKENKTFKLLYQHDRYEPIGSFGGKEDDHGFFIKAQLVLDTISTGHPAVPNAHKTHALIKNGVLDSLSIGYDVIKFDDEMDKGKRIRNIRELKLWEGSVVTFAMNPNAQIRNVKAIHEIRQLLHSRQMSIEDLIQLLELQPGEKLVGTEQPDEIIEKSAHRFSKTIDALRNFKI